MPSTISHRHKRPFQPQITSYFAREDRDYADNSSRPHTPLEGPVLSHQVQASLLSVGMRIRKAVPEGYKTHKTLLFDDPTPAKAYTANTSANMSAGYARPRELLPYCGLLDVGGLRQSDPVNAQGDIDIYADEMPFNVSQESNISSISADSAPPQARVPVYNWNKRRFEDEENENVFGLDEGEGEDVTPSFHFNFSTGGEAPLDLSISSRREFSASHASVPHLDAPAEARPMAVPRSRRRGQPALVDPVGQQVDFEEAEFLVPWDDVDMDMV